MVSAVGTPGPSATCRAPHVALRFSPQGHVHACCVNDLYPLGHVDEASLAEIWQGERADRLRTALDGADYSLGCRACEQEHRVGARRQTHAEAYDRFPQPAEPLAWPLRLEFALSNTCNLQCVQCNGDLSSAIRAQREHRPPLRPAYGDDFFAQLPELLSHAEVTVFIGGEPFLAREPRRVWDLMIDLGVLPEVNVTTNGTVWNDEVERYLHALEMNVAVSVDGALASTNEAIRLGSRHDEVVANRDRFLAATRAYGGGFSLNHCWMVQNRGELVDVLAEGDRLDVPVHVIPVMDPPSMSLFSLPEAELAEVVAEMASDARADDLGRNRAAWEAGLAHLRARLAELGSAGRPVALGARRPVPGLDDQVERFRAELESWSGQPPLVLRTRNGTVRSVASPPWASALDLDGLVGRPLDEVEARVDAWFGPILDVRPEALDGGHTAVDHTRRRGDRVVAFRTVVVADWGVMTATPVAGLSST